MKTQFVGIDKQLTKMQNIIDVWLQQRSMMNTGSIKPRFLSIGPTGSGKTSTLQHLSEVNKIKMINLSAPLITPAGFKGVNIGNVLPTNLKQPGILFIDEFDKIFASKHQDVKEFREDICHELLNLLGDGKLRIERGDKPVDLDFSKWLIVLAGAFENSKISIEDDMRKIQDKLEDAGLNRQLLGRLNDFVVFPEATKEIIGDAIDLKLERYVSEVKYKGKITRKDVEKFITINKGFERFGFRSIDHAIFQLICNKK